MAGANFECKVISALEDIRKEQARQAKRLDALEAGVLNLSAELALSDVDHGPEDHDERIRDRLDGLEEGAFGSG